MIHKQEIQISKNIFQRGRETFLFVFYNTGNQGNKTQLVYLEDCRITIYCPYVDTVCRLERQPGGDSPDAAVSMKSTQRGKARFRQVVQRRTSPPLCFIGWICPLDLLRWRVLVWPSAARPLVQDKHMSESQTDFLA